MRFHNGSLTPIRESWGQKSKNREYPGASFLKKNPTQMSTDDDFTCVRYL